MALAKKSPSGVTRSLRMQAKDVVKVAEGIEVGRVGSIEVWRGRRAVWADGWAVFIDGRPQYPWLQKCAARKLAGDIAHELGRK